MRPTQRCILSFGSITVALLAGVPMSLRRNSKDQNEWEADKRPMGDRRPPESGNVAVHRNGKEYICHLQESEGTAWCFDSVRVCLCACLNRHFCSSEMTCKQARLHFSSQLINSSILFYPTTAHPAHNFRIQQDAIEGHISSTG